MMPPKVLLKDDFRNGLDLTGTWALVRRPPSFVADHGVVSASDQGLHVKAAGTNPLTPNLFGQGAELRVERFEITSVNES